MREVQKARVEPSRNVPKLRFPEFKGDLGYSTLGDSTIWKSGGTPKKDNPRYWNGNIPWISASEMRGKYYEQSQYNITTEALGKGSKLAEKGSLLLLVRGSMLFNKIPVGIAKVDLAFNQDVKSLLPKKNILSEYLFQWFQSNEHRIMNLVVGTGIGAGKLDTNEMQSLIIHVPTLPEQTKIANFLTAVDAKIANLNEEKSLLENYKKGVMQKLFNGKWKTENGKMQFIPPSLRFKQDDGSDFPEWETKRLIEFVDEFIVPMRDKPKSLDGEIPWCRIEDFEGKYLSKSKSKQGVSLSTVKEMNLKVYPVNTLLVSCSANLGFCAIVQKPLVTNQTFIGLYPNLEKISIDYLYHVMKMSSRRLNILSSGTTISYLSRKQFEKFTIDYPCLSEQTKIANFLTSIDEKINTVTEAIEKAQEWKKGLLQQLFI